jgi:hypothetical protein
MDYKCKNNPRFRDCEYIFSSSDPICGGCVNRKLDKQGDARQKLAYTRPLLYQCSREWVSHD